MTSSPDKRREKGSGSISKIDDKKFVGRLDLGIKADGKRKVKKFTGASENEVKRKMRVYWQNPDQVIGGDVSGVSLEVAILDWLRTYKLPALKPSSYDRLESTILNKILPTLGTDLVQDISSADIQALINSMSRVPDGTDKRQSSYSSVKKVYDALNAFFKHTADELPKNPMNKVVMPASSKFESKVIRAFSTEEVAKIQKEISRTWNSSGNPVYPYGVAYNLILNTGMRCGEMIALDRVDVDMKDGMRLSVSKNLVMCKKRKGDYTVAGGYEAEIQDTTKTRAGTRYIDLNKGAIEALRVLYARHPDALCVVASANGERVRYANFERTFGTILKNCKIKDASVHTLRHTFATRLFEKGADVKTVSSILGHSSVTVTYNTYIHVIQAKKQNVMALLDG